MTEDSVLGLKATIAGILAVLTALWGWFGWLVVIWVLLMLTDWAMGSILACKKGCWDSARVREGAWHKTGMVLTFLISLAADWLIGLTLEHLPMIHLPFAYTVLLSPLVLVWYIVGELGSLAEHAVSTGAPVPAWLLRILEAGRRAVDAVGDQVSTEKGGKKDTAPSEKEGGDGS